MTTRFDEVVAGLRLPAIAAPMTFISTPELVAEACVAGIIGAFPTSNARSINELDEWFDQIESRRATAETGHGTGAVAANLIVGKQNKRLDEDVECVVARRPQFVITSVGSPAPVIAPLQRAGCVVLADVASEVHAHKALAAGADGLVLLSAGAGGHTGWANPFAFVRSVRSFFDGPLVLTGGMSDGHALWAARTVGCDLGMFGTRFIATDEAATPAAWQAALERSTMDNITVVTAPNGVAASALPDDAGSAGHTVSAVSTRQPVAALVDELQVGWADARSHARRLLSEQT